MSSYIFILSQTEFVTSDSKQHQTELLLYYLFYSHIYLIILSFQMKKSRQSLAACL